MNDRYHVQVYVREGGKTFAWRRVCPGRGDPYVFTKAGAEKFILDQPVEHRHNYRVEQI